MEVGTAMRTSETIDTRPVMRPGVVREFPVRPVPHWTAAKALRVGPSKPGLVAISRMLIDPVTAVGMLLVASLLFGSALTAQHVFLASLTAALTLAFRSPDATYSGSAVVLRWMLIASLLLMIGWTTGTLTLFDGGFALAWLISVPTAQHVVHRYVVPGLTQIFAAAPVRRTAVVAG